MYKSTRIILLPSRMDEFFKVTSKLSSRYVQNGEFRFSDSTYHSNFHPQPDYPKFKMEARICPLPIIGSDFEEIQEEVNFKLGDKNEDLPKNKWTIKEVASVVSITGVVSTLGYLGLCTMAETNMGLCTDNLSDDPALSAKYFVLASKETFTKSSIFVREITSGRAFKPIEQNQSNDE